MPNIQRPPLIFRTWHKQPWAVAVGSQKWVWQDPMNLRLVGKDTFFRTAGYAPAYDYPNPTLPKDRRVAANTTHEQQSDRLNNLLVKQDRVFGGPGQTHPYDWPNPTWPKPRFVSVASQDWIVSDRNNNLLVKQDIIWGARGQVPTYDWQNPNRLKNERGVSVEAESGVLQNWLLGTLRGQDQIYGAPGEVPDYDWTNPVWPKEWRGAAIRAEDGVLQNWLLGTLQSQDRIYGGPGEVPDYDWPNPTWPKNRYVAIAAQALVAFNVALFAPAPLVQRDWPNPVLPISRQVALRAQAEVSQNELGFNLVGQDVIWRSPGEVPTYDWTNPTLPLSRQTASRSQVEVWPDNWLPTFFNTTTDRYWVGGTDNWNASNAAKWATSSGGIGGAATPTSANDVFLDANSSPATITISATANCKNFDCQGFTGTLAGSSALNVAGTLYRLVGPMAVTYSGTTTFTSSGAATITSAGHTIGQVTINGTGSFQLQDALNVGANQIVLTKGTFDMNGQDTTSTVFSSSNANTRKIIFGGTMHLTGTGTVYNASTATGLTTDVTIGTVDVNSVSSLDKLVNTGGVAIPNLKRSAGAGNFTTQGAFGMACNDLDFTGFSGTWVQNNNSEIAGNFTLASGMTVSHDNKEIDMVATSGTKTITSNGVLLPARVYIIAPGATIQLADDLTLKSDEYEFVLVQGTFDANGHSLEAIFFDNIGSGTREEFMGSGTWTIGAQGGTLWEVSGTNVTFHSQNSTIKFNGSGSLVGVTTTFKGGGYTYNNLWNAGSNFNWLKVLGANTFNDIKISAGQTVKFDHTATQTITSLTVPVSSGNGITLDSDDGVNPFTLSKPSGTVSVYGCTIKNSTATGGATWYALTLNGNVDGGGNSGWIFSFGRPSLEQPDLQNPARGSLPRVALGSQDGVSAGQSLFQVANTPLSQFTWPLPRMVGSLNAIAAQDWVGAGLALSQGATAVAPFAQVEWPNPSRGVVWSIALNAEQGSGGRIPPSPPVIAQSPWSGMIYNMGKMMGRRG